MRKHEKDSRNNLLKEEGTEQTQDEVQTAKKIVSGVKK